MKIAIIGTHSVGKTTLLNELKKHLDIPIITEVARRFPVNENNYDCVDLMKLQTDIFHEQMHLEMIVDNFLSDRSTIDNAAYIRYTLNKCGKHLTREHYSYVLNQIEIAKEHAKKYDFLFYIPIEFKCVDDGFRSTDEKERIFIDEEIKNSDAFKYIITGTVEERVNKVLSKLKRGIINE